MIDKKAGLGSAGFEVVKPTCASRIPTEPDMDPDWLFLVG